MKATLLTIALLICITPASALEEGGSLALAFQLEVDRKLDVPVGEQMRYALMLDSELQHAASPLEGSQYVLLVDRSPYVQAIFVYWVHAQRDVMSWRYIGAAPTSTGKPGKFDHFYTPLGVFAHTVDNLDYRAEGTFNGFGIRALGHKGMRAYDFGWVQGERGWGRGGWGQMRLLMHATDPDKLEPLLGIALSKGCIRIPATLNTFIDRYGLLDADYLQARAEGRKLHVLRPDRIATPWAGRYLVVVDSERTARPAWSPEPVAIIPEPAASGVPASAVSPEPLAPTP